MPRHDADVGMQLFNTEEERNFMKITIKELSHISGYSSSTICRVINNSPGVKPETREEIKKLLEKYQYRTNVMELRRLTANNRKVMVIVGDLENTFYMEQVRAVNRILGENGYNTMIVTSECNHGEEEKYVEMAQHESYAGIIFIDISPRLPQDDESGGGLPMICMNRNIPFSSYGSVITDNYQGGYKATQYLIDKGHRKIIYLAGKNSSFSVQERGRGFRDAMLKNGIPVTANSIYSGNLDIKSGYTFGEMKVKKCLDCTAVFIANVQMGIGFMKAMNDYSVSIPDDISMICYDHSSMARSLNITSVGVSPCKMAEKTVDILMGSLKGETVEVQDVLIRPCIEERRTVKSMI